LLNSKDYKKLHYLINIAYIATFLVLAYFVVRYILGAVVPFIIALVAAFAVEPLVRLLSIKLRFPRGLASALSVLLLLGIVVSLGGVVSTTIWGETKALISKVPDYLHSIVGYVQGFMEERSGFLSFFPDDVLDKAIDYIANYDYSSLVTGSLGSLVLGYAGNVVVHIPNALIFVIVTVVSSIFMSSSFPVVKTFILSQFSGKHQSLILDIKNDFFATIWKYLRSYSLLIVITFAELLIFFLIFGFEPALPLAFLIAIVDILPILGVGTVLLPWALFCLLSGSPWQALILLCMYIVITVVRQILEPKIIGDHVGMLPILTLFCIWVGLKLLGFFGMFLVPITVVILKNLHENGKIKIWKTANEKAEKGEASGS